MDLKIFSLSVLLSSVFIYNSYPFGDLGWDISMRKPWKTCPTCSESARTSGCALKVRLIAKWPNAFHSSIGCSETFHLISRECRRSNIHFMQRLSRKCAKAHQQRVKRPQKSNPLSNSQTVHSSSLRMLPAPHQRLRSSRPHRRSALRGPPLEIQGQNAAILKRILREPSSKDSER